MSTSRLVPLIAGPPLGRGRRPSQRWAWTLAVSLVLHALLLAAFLAIAPRPDEDDGAPPPSYQLMFDTPESNAPPARPGQPDAGPPTPGPATAPTAPPPPPAPVVEDAVPGPQSPDPTAPPTPDALPLPPAPTEPVPQTPTQTAPTPAPPVPVPQPALAPAAPPDPAPPAPAAPPEATTTPEPAPLPPPPSVPQVNIEAPPPEAPPPPLIPELVLPAPPPPLPPPPPRPAVQRPRTAPPPQVQAGTLNNPLDSLNFGPSTSRSAAARVGARPGSVASRSLDLSPGAPKGPNHAEAFFDARAARLGADWEEALKTYWLRHRYYPQQAAENGEDGTVDLELTVTSTGRVQSAVIKSRSGSQFIDMAAVGTWRNAQLPPLPPELGANYTFTITIDYILLR